MCSGKAAGVWPASQSPLPAQEALKAKECMAEKSAALETAQKAAEVLNSGAFIPRPPFNSSSNIMLADSDLQLGPICLPGRTQTISRPHTEEILLKGLKS